MKRLIWFGIQINVFKADGQLEMITTKTLIWPVNSLCNYMVIIAFFSTPLNVLFESIKFSSFHDELKERYLKPLLNWDISIRVWIPL